MRGIAEVSSVLSLGDLELPLSSFNFLSFDFFSIVAESEAGSAFVPRSCAA